MKAKKLLILMSIFLFSCQQNIQSTANQENTSNTSFESNQSSSFSELNSENSQEYSSISENTSSFTSTNTSHVSSNESSSSQNEIKTKKINEVKPLCLALKNQVNDVDVAKSDEVVKISGVLLNRIDVVTTKSGYGNRYKLFIADETDYIYVQIDLTTYKKVENSIGKTFSFTGNIALYCQEPEIILTHYEEQTTSINVDFDKLSTSYTSVNQIHLKEQTLPTNCKGIAASSLISISLKYIGIHDDKVLLFTDGKELILLHTRDKVKNSLVLNNSYKIYATLNMYYYRPGLDYISHTRTEEEINLDSLKDNAKDITSSELYQTKLYDKDNSKSNVFYTKYTSRYQYLYHFKGYYDYYVKNGKYYFVLLDNSIEHDNDWTKETASNNKVLFIVNDSHYNLSYDEIKYRDFYEDFYNQNQVDIYFSLDLYNTEKYYQIFIY